MVDRFEQFVSLIDRIYRNIQKIERSEMERYGLKGSYAQYLLAMRRFPQGITAAQLCEICGKDKAAVSRAVSEMEPRGLISRDGSTYRSVLRLTPEGGHAAQYVCSKATAAMELAGISDNDREMLYTTLTQIAGNLELICKEGIE